MKFNPDIHHRRSIRLKHYDYSRSGAYFVTVCTKNRVCLFGEIAHGEMQLNDAGRIIQDVWNGLPRRYPHVQLETFIVMPNHVHGIVVITDYVGAGLALPNKNALSNKQGAASGAPTLGDVIRAFKSLSAMAVNRALRRSGQPLWQRNYYERVVRDEDELTRTAEYILTNPAHWAEDENHPAAMDMADRHVVT